MPEYDPQTTPSDTLPPIVAGAQQRLPDPRTGCDVTFRAATQRQPETPGGGAQGGDQDHVPWLVEAEPEPVSAFVSLADVVLVGEIG